MRASPSGKASAFQADIREFESRRPLFNEVKLNVSIIPPKQRRCFLLS